MEKKRNTKTQALCSNAKQNRTAALLLALLLCLPLSGCADSARQATRSGFYFDTIISLSAYGSHADQALEGALALCERYERLLGRTVKGSDIWKINHAGGKSVQVDRETAVLLQTALDWADRTQGLIDPTIAPLSELWNFTGDPPGPVPSQERIDALLSHVDYRKVTVTLSDPACVTLSDPDAQLDLGFIAKGYIADRLKDYFLEQGIQSALINLGGNVLALGEKPDGSAFRTGIRKPFGNDGELLGVVELRDRSLVSSGSYERFFEQDGVLYHHILDPNSGRPADTGLDSVTILSDSSADGDALSTACFLLGYEKGRELIDSLPGVEALFSMSDGTICRTEGFPKAS
ncbi:MAG: FAD:protein FMN transferase [Eubacteriales bacterium]|nr:FAD:protein FMN transferase [Eubacteriales bacterium]